ncbi:MAG: polysaccharide deacetylase family protein [Cocleimonas sp.]|nr:polysaccharide deacetylase family protein [Cocleimonas sp.]
MDFDWKLLGIVLLVLLVLFVIGMTTIMYIRHWAARYPLSNHLHFEGRYFKRYIPPSKALVHKTLQDKKNKTEDFLVKTIRKILIFGLAGLLLFGIAINLYLNRDHFFKPALNNKDIAKLSFTHHSWERTHVEQLPKLKDQLVKLKKKGVYLIYDTKNKTQSIYDWEAFALKHRLPLSRCRTKNIQRCYQIKPKALFVVIEGQWNLTALDSILNQGANVLFTGYPEQLKQQKIKGSFDLYHLHFQRFYQSHAQTSLALVADRALTLGFDAGLIFDINSSNKDYVATSDHPQALFIDSSKRALPKIWTRLYAETVGKGRFIWMDFNLSDLPTYSEQNRQYSNALLASLLRYFSKEPYSALAMWPDGKKFAAILEEDTEDGFAKAEKVSDFFLKNKYPITWYILSNEAQRDHGLSKKLAESGEIACHGDNHQVFTLNDSRTQHLRLAHCRKVLELITGKTVRSFRPPEEAHNGYTLDAMLNNNIEYFIAETSLDRFVPLLLISKKTAQSLVSIPRMMTDDFELWVDIEANKALSQRQMSLELDYTEAVGGLYLFSFHSQFMDNKDHFLAIKLIAKAIDSKPSYFTTAGGLSEWWKLRVALMKGEPSSKQLIKKYNVKKVHVNSQGELSFKPY